MNRFPTTNPQRRPANAKPRPGGNSSQRTQPRLPPHVNSVGRPSAASRMAMKGVVTEDTPPSSPSGRSHPIMSPFERLNRVQGNSKPSNSNSRRAASDLPAAVHVDPNEIHHWPFPIDLVYTWVNGTDRNWTYKKQQYLQQYNTERLTADSVAECRWQHFDELRHSVESVQFFAPWIRAIWIVTDQQIPSWYNPQNPGNVRIIDHRQVFVGYENDLPTFNSHAIETHLHQIPDLAEHFIYANDDMFMGNYVSPSDFFSPQGHFKVFLNGTLLNKFSPTTNQNIDFNEVCLHSFSEGISADVLNECVGFNPERTTIRHQMKPLTKSVLQKCWEHPLLKDYLEQTSNARFRSIGDVEPCSLFCWIGIETNVAIVGDITSTYYPIVPDTDVSKMFQHLRQKRPCVKLYCVNNCLESSSPAQNQQIIQGLETCLPHQFIRHTEH